MTSYVQTVSVNHKTALRAVGVAIEEGAKIGLAVAVTVVDPSLGLVAFGRADGTTPHSVQTSRRKANTGASTRRPSGWMQGDFAVALPMGSANLLTNIRGGFPLVVEGKHIGGLGVAGGTPDQDAEVALATLSALGLETP